MITYIPFKAEHGVKIASMINGNFLRMMEVHEKLGQSLTALYGDEILCCGGIDPVWEGVGEAWTVMPNAARGSALARVRFHTWT